LLPFVRIPDLRSLLPHGRPSAVTLTTAGLLSLSAGIIVGLLVFNGGTKTAASSVVDIASTTPALTATPTPEPTATAAPAAKPFLIKNAGSGMCVDLPGDGIVTSVVNVTQYTCLAPNEDNQQYTMADSGGGAFLLRNVRSGMCLDVSGYEAREPGAEILIFSCEGVPAEDNLMFRSRPADGGVHLINVKSNLCLDVSDAEGTTDDLNQKLWLAECSDSASQVWAFV
jgi:hypothetical protein